jgi:hypothetical protein
MHPPRGHVAARFIYLTILNNHVGGFDIHRFILSSDVLRVIIFPESLNGETGLVCSYMGGVSEFSGLKVSEIIEGAKSAREFTSRLTLSPRTDYE